MAPACRGAGAEREQNYPWATKAPPQLKAAEPRKMSRATGVARGIFERRAQFAADRLQLDKRKVGGVSHTRFIASMRPWPQGSPNVQNVGSILLVFACMVFPLGCRERPSCGDCLAARIYRGRSL